jgi:hypothetical protein
MKRAVLLLITLISTNVIAQTGVPVTVNNFARAETDMYMGKIVEEGGFGTFVHNRMPTEIDKQTVIRMNRDTLYSSAVFDLDAGPVTITLPNAGNRFMTLQVINEDHYVPLVMKDKDRSITLTKDKVGDSVRGYLGSYFCRPRYAHGS